MNQKNSSAPASGSIFFSTLDTVLFIVVFMVALASGPQMLSIDSDLGRHLTIGNYILDHRIIPTHDLFSHTLSSQSRPPYEWLSQIIFALVNRLLGLDGTVFFTAVTLAVIFTLTSIYANRRSRSPIIAFAITLLAMGASSVHWLPRPHIFTFLLLIVWVENLEQAINGKAVKLFTFFLLMLFWANLHGGFVFGILAWGAYFAGWVWDRWRNKTDPKTGWLFVKIGFVSLAASVMTPDLWHNWEAVLNNRSSFILSRTAETMPPDLTSSSFFPFTILLLLTVILYLLNYRSVSARHYFLLIGLGGTSLLISRNIPLFVIVCVPIIASLAKTSLARINDWEQIEKRFARFGSTTRWGIPAIAVIVMAVLFFAYRSNTRQNAFFQFDPHVFPVQAMDWLEYHPQSGRMFNEFNWGGYILYRAWPREQVFLDSQSDFYGEPLMREYDQVMSVRGDWELVLQKYQVKWVIISFTAPLAEELKTQGWETAYEDETSIILVRP